LKKRHYQVLLGIAHLLSRVGFWFRPAVVKVLHLEFTITLLALNHIRRRTGIVLAAALRALPGVPAGSKDYAGHWMLSPFS
ncbi:MAG: hypothetical protein WBB65_04200, partial [Anaerolineales bacterium]